MGGGVGRGAKIPHASGPKNQNIKQKQYCNKFNKDFKNGPHEKKKRDRERASVLSASPMKFSGKELKLAQLNLGDKSRPIHCGHRESDIAPGWQLPK